MRSLGPLVRMQTLIQQVWDGAREPAFRTGSQVLPMLLLPGPHLGQEGCKAVRSLPDTSSRPSPPQLGPHNSIVVAPYAVIITDNYAIASVNWVQFMWQALS